MMRFNVVTVAQPLSPKHVTFAHRPLPSCLFFFNPHLVVLRPSFSSPFLPLLSHNLRWPPFWFWDNLSAHPLHVSHIHASWLVFSLHPTTITLFRYSSTPLVTTPSADSTSCPFQWIGFDRALCLRHRHAVLFFLFCLPFWSLLCITSARRYNPQCRHSVPSTYSPNPRSYHASCSMPRACLMFSSFDSPLPRINHSTFAHIHFYLSYFLT